jgi:hypothetical protein
MKTFIVNIINLICLIAAAFWMGKEQSGASFFVFLTFLSTYILIIVKSNNWKVNDFDKDLFIKFINDFSPNHIGMRLIQDHDFMGIFKWDDINVIFRNVETWKREGYSFNNLRIERKRKIFFTLIDELYCVIAGKIWPIDEDKSGHDSGYYGLKYKFADDLKAREESAMVGTAANKIASKAYRTYKKLLIIGRKKFHIVDSP